MCKIKHKTTVRCQNGFKKQINLTVSIAGIDLDQQEHSSTADGNEK